MENEKVHNLQGVTRMNYSDLFSLIGSTAGIATPILITIIYWLIRHDAVRNAHREVTQQVYKEWWSDELSDYRKYLFREFVPLHREKLLGKKLKKSRLSFPKIMAKSVNYATFSNGLAGWGRRV